MSRFFAIERWKAFPQDNGGNYAIIFSVLLTTLLVAAGAGIDGVETVTVRSDIQNAMDSAVIAAAANGDTLDTDYATKFFLSNLPTASTNTDADIDSNNRINISSVSFTTDSDGNIVGTARATLKTTILGLAGIPTVNLTIKAKSAGSVEQKIESATFKIKSAQGAYDKDIYFFTRDSEGNVVDETLILEYDYQYSRWGSHKYYTPAKTSDTTINVGDYSAYGYKMVVYEDNTYTGQHTNPKEYYSDDADAPTWTKVVGECTDSGGSTNYWEDGGDANYLDFVFTVVCTEGSSGASSVRLVE